MIGKRVIAAMLFAVALLGLGAAAQARDRDIVVKAVKTGTLLVVKVEYLVRAPVATVWEVMTDWDNMARFLPSVLESTIASKTGNRYRVRQKGRVYLGLFPVSFKAVRDFDLFSPERMRFTGVSGEFERLEGEVKLSVSGEETRLVYRAESVPTVWVPPFVGAAMIEHVARVQFGELRAEILRRHAARAGQEGVAPVPRPEH